MTSSPISTSLSMDDLFTILSDGRYKTQYVYNILKYIILKIEASPDALNTIMTCYTFRYSYVDCYTEIDEDDWESSIKILYNYAQKMSCEQIRAKIEEFSEKSLLMYYPQFYCNDLCEEDFVVFNVLGIIFSSCLKSKLANPDLLTNNELCMLFFDLMTNVYESTIQTEYDKKLQEFENIKGVVQKKLTALEFANEMFDVNSQKNADIYNLNVNITAMLTSLDVLIDKLIVDIMKCRIINTHKGDPVSMYDTSTATPLIDKEKLLLHLHVLRETLDTSSKIILLPKVSNTTKDELSEDELPEDELPEDERSEDELSEDGRSEDKLPEKTREIISNEDAMFDDLYIF